MFDPKDFPFNAEKMAEFFQSNKFTSGLAGEMSGSAEEIVKSQQKNMEALVEANKAAAASYQALFAKQLEVFEKTMAQTKAQMENADLNTQGEATKTAFESALKNMSDLATGAQKANSDAMEIVGKRVQESLQELKDLSNTDPKK